MKEYWNIGAVVHWEHSAEIGIILFGGQRKKGGNAGQKKSRKRLILPRPDPEPTLTDFVSLPNDAFEEEEHSIRVGRGVTLHIYISLSLSDPNVTYQ